MDKSPTGFDLAMVHPEQWKQHACPTCSAGISQSCTTIAGWVTSPHRTRTAVAWRALNPEA